MSSKFIWTKDYNGTREWKLPSDITNDLKKIAVGQRLVWPHPIDPPSEIYGVCLPADGQEYPRLQYQEGFDIVSLYGSVIPESTWQSYISAGNSSVGFFSDGDGSTTFRMPLLNDFDRATAGSRNVGSFQGDAIRNIKGSFAVRRVGGGDNLSVSSSGVCDSGQEDPNYSRPSMSGGSIVRPAQLLKIDVSRTVPTGSENRPANIAVKIFYRMS